jgi:hypothetical protein
MGRLLATSHGRVCAVPAEDVFRNANKHVAAKARELEVRSPIPFLCECSDPRCFSDIVLTLDEYEHTAGPQRYMTVPGHIIGGTAPVAEDGRFVLVAKL